MRKLTLILMFACISCCVLANFIKNPDFDAEKLYPEVWFEYSTNSKKSFKYAKFSESPSWNSCLKFKLKQMPKQEGKRLLSGTIFIGFTRKTPGFKVKPNTTYRVAFSLKGTAKKFYLKAMEFYSTIRYKNRKKLIYKYKIPPVINADHWNRVEATFTTGPKAKFAALAFQYWWDEKYGPLEKYFKVGDYVLIDKVSVEEAVSVLPQLNKTTAKVKKKITKVVDIPLISTPPVIDGKLSDSCWEQASRGQDFKILASISQDSPKAATSFKICRDANNVYLGIKCLEPNMAKLKSSFSGTGSKVWKDDMVEIFFSPGWNHDKLLQIAVSAGGGLYIGNQVPQELKNAYTKLKVKTFKGQKNWNIELKFPYVLKPHAYAKFNICRLRSQDREKSCWSPITRNFHNVKEYGIAFFSNPTAWMKIQIAQLEKQIKDTPDSKAKKQILKKLNQTKKITGTAAVLYNSIMDLKVHASFLKTANLKFTLVMPAAHNQPRLPFLPDELVSPLTKINITAAVNEIVRLPLALVNLTNKTAEYQVFLSPEKINKGREKWGLEGTAGVFPQKQIVEMRAIRVKDADKVNTPIRFDPLVALDASHTVCAAGRDSALLYYNFDCTKVKPGKYSGYIHVVPLSDPIPNYKRGQRYRWSQILSLPFELNVLPIELPPNPKISLFMFDKCYNESDMKLMLGYGVRWFGVDVWSMKIKFNADGSIKSRNITPAVECVRNQLAMARKFRPDVKINFMFIHGVYEIFLIRGGKRFKMGSPAWKRAWQNNIKALADVFREAGVPLNRTTYELADEPSIPRHLKNISMQEWGRIANLAKEIEPNFPSLVALDSHATPQLYEPLLKAVDIWTYWDGLLGNKMLEQSKKLRKQGKRIWMYRCNMGIDNDLHQYYRLHAWRGALHGVETIAMWGHIDRPRGFPTQWRTAPSGGMHYLLNNQAFSTVRSQMLGKGFGDMQYWEKLNSLVQKAKKTGKNAELARKAQKFLHETLSKAIKNPSDFRIPDEFRKQAILLILQLQKSN